MNRICTPSTIISQPSTLLTGIGVERHTPVAVCKDLPNRNRGRATLMPVHFPSESGLPAETTHGRSNDRTPNSVRLGFLFPRREIPVPARSFTNLAAVVQLRLRVRAWVANFDSEVPALNRRELGANPRRPTISASVVKLLSCSASNGEFAGGSPAGCTNLCRVSPTTRDAPLRTERLGVEIPHAAPAFGPAPAAYVVQCRDSALKTRRVSVQIRPWALVAVCKHRV